jgi:class 3 adenylate cyclase
MNILLVSLLLFVFLLSVVFYFKLKRINELKDKTDFAVESEELIKVEFTGDDAAAHIAKNFNILADKLVNYKLQSSNLKGIESKKILQDEKLKNFEESLSQLNVLTEIGRQITASLNISEIALKLFKFINSTMMADEVSLLISKDTNKYYYNVFNGSLALVSDTEWCQDKDNILNWSYDNNKEVYLNDAALDFAQYVFKQVKMQNGELVGAAIAIPLSISNLMIGSVAIVCKRKHIFNDYHLDFSRSLASYVSVAIYNANLYGELAEEKHKSEELLLNILPEEVADELKLNGKSEAKLYKNVTVLFTDFVNFTGISSTLSPTALVAEIDYCFRVFDEIIGRHGLEKIKTIGDAYLAVCGLPNENPEHALNAVKAAIEIRDFIQTPDTYFTKYPLSKDSQSEMKSPFKSRFTSIRLGINSGPVVAGIVGSKKFAYDIWGDTVNVASRMESNSDYDKINISGSTYDLVKDIYPCIYRGKINAKNKGEIDMYFIE